MSDPMLYGSPNWVRCWVNCIRSNWTESCGGLRFFCAGRPTRITYWIAPGRVIVLLTVFAKTRPNERREVERAKTVLQRWMTEHGLPGAQDE